MILVCMIWREIGCKSLYGPSAEVLQAFKNIYVLNVGKEMCGVCNKKNVIEFLVIIFISTNYPMMLSTMWSREKKWVISLVKDSECDAGNNFPTITPIIHHHACGPVFQLHSCWSFLSEVDWTIGVGGRRYQVCSCRRRSIYVHERMILCSGRFTFYKSLKRSYNSRHISSISANKLLTLASDDIATLSFELHQNVNTETFHPILTHQATHQIKTQMPNLFRGEFDTGIYPDEWHWWEGISLPSAAREMCNSWKSSRCIASIVLNEELGKFIAQVMEWYSVRIGQDDLVWKPPAECVLSLVATIRKRIGLIQLVFTKIALTYLHNLSCTKTILLHCKWVLMMLTRRLVVLSMQ
jgi:hypothetical protein